jgi:cytochrome c oxidase subunit 1
MQATSHTGYAGNHDHDSHGHPTGWMRWVTTTNHKDIGTMYLWFSFVMFLVGGAMSLILRAELFAPGCSTCRPSSTTRC